jgi:DNA-binding NtrC family response regulator
VRSEPGQGTSFEILLPRAAAAEATPLGPAQPVETRGGTETILLVEDEPQIRSMVTEALQVQGYQVLTSRGGSEAIRLAQEHPGPIHLLLTDVVMPQMSGPQTAERLGAARPGLKVLYMSGYAESAIAHHGILEEKISLLAKPFTLQTLAQRVREELDR